MFFFSFPPPSLCLAGSGQMVQMDTSKSGFVGSQVELRCVFINSNPPVKISQVTWQKLLNGTKQNVAIANPALGVSVLPPFKERVSFKHAAVRHRTPSLEDTTIVFSNLQLSDEAAYICEYTTFPAGNRENMVNLTVYGKNCTDFNSALICNLKGTFFPNLVLANIKQFCRDLNLSNLIAHCFPFSGLVSRIYLKLISTKAVAEHSKHVLNVYMDLWVSH